MKIKLLVILFICAFSHYCAFSHELKKGKVHYILEDDKAYIVGFDQMTTKVTIEPEISYKKHTYKVVGVKLDNNPNPYYKDQTSTIREITFAENVTEVFDNIALNMTTLEKVVLPNTITAIGQSAFSGCTLLSEIHIPESVKIIGRNAFSGCTSLKRITLPQGLTVIDEKAFKGCIGMDSINIPNSVKRISKEAFRGCSSLREIEIPRTVNRIGTGIFWDCTALIKVRILCAVNKIPDFFFRDCRSLKSIAILQSIRLIGVEAFRGCTTLKAMNVPQKVTNIETNAFYGCSSLQRVLFPDGLQEISKGAFCECTSLKEVSLPKSLKSIGQTAFSRCGNLTSVNIPDSVNTIGKEAFQGCSSLQRIVIPPSVSNVSEGVFKDCSSLSAVIVQSDIKEIPESFFSGCKSLKSIVIPNSVKSVGVESFMNCSDLENVILPDSARYLTDAEATKQKMSDNYRRLNRLGADTKEIENIITERGSFYGCKSLTNIKCHNGSIPADILNYIPADCLFALNGGKSANPDFEISVLGSVANDSAEGSAEIPSNHKFKFVMKSDVDMSIPIIKENNDSTFAIIIGNENYEMVSNVKYAEHDARVFAEYCKNTLGLPEKNIHIFYDASYNQMVEAIQFFKSVSSDNNKKKFNIIFYYSGHGIPNESSRDAFLLPVNADGSITDACLAVGQLYKELADVKANRVLVFLDACFSGSQRDGGVLQASARGVAIKAKPAEPTGNMIVFSAATGDETAYPFEGKSHGLFTYYLLKKIKETEGNVSLGELAGYIKKNVGTTSVLENKKSQTPTVTPSHGIGATWTKLQLR